MNLEKYSLGIGDRFGKEGAAQLRALQKAEILGVPIVPVWNKSNREHVLIGTSPEDIRREADAAVKLCHWKHRYYVDADHIGMKTVGRYIECSDFFTIDVADYIGKRPSRDAVIEFVNSMKRFKGSLTIPSIQEPFLVTDDVLVSVAEKYLCAIQEAERVYRHISGRKGPDNFIPEISADETDTPQTPIELFFILGAIAQSRIPIQTIAPKFTGAFLKGVDYVGDIKLFKKEFEEDLAVVAYASKVFDFPSNLKLSVHSGSDKFSLYPVMRRALQESGAGLHLKTAGTTWLEEVIALAGQGGEALKFVKELYTKSLKRYDELCEPYRTVIHIDRTGLPDSTSVNDWSAGEFVEALEHDQSCPGFDRQFRQFIHIAFRVAAETGARFTDLLTEHREAIEFRVTRNLLDRHILPLFANQPTDGKRESVSPQKTASEA